jgi:hypothetical protein
MPIPMTFELNGREIPRFDTVEGPDGPELIETVDWHNFIRKKRQRDMMTIANVYEPDKTYIGDDGVMTKIHTYIDKFTSIGYPSLYLWSMKNGTQKSTVARYLGRELIKKDFLAHMLLMSDLVAALTRRGFDDEDHWLLERIEAVDLLIIDDSFDPKKITVYKSGYQVPFLDTFLRRRLEAIRKPICFTSNISIDSISDTFGNSIRSLVRRSTAPIEMNSEINDFDVKKLWL